MAATPRPLNMTSVTAMTVTDTLAKVGGINNPAISIKTSSSISSSGSKDASKGSEDKPNDDHLAAHPTTTPPPPLTRQPTQLKPGASNQIASTQDTNNNSNSNAAKRINALSVSVVVVGLLLVLAAVIFVVRRKKRLMASRGKRLGTPDDDDAMTQQSTRHGNTGEDTVASYSETTSPFFVINRPHHQGPKLQHATSSMSDDPEITAMRIPMEKIQIGSVLSRGGFGEVLQGMYKGQQVAIKRLLPERRKDLGQIEAFLCEAKLMGSLEHERIVTFIGVAWDALAEICVVSEFMDGGDLRSVLAQFESDRRLHGFDHDKIKIALHVAHAMTYLHSLQPVVLHRDLKSKNILLTKEFDAKVTDFGVSRERIDATMTAGVGTSLWMAPEVMMGERYDDKADVFSFGVVLSELDTHLHPYSHASEPGTGRKLPDTAVLQMVALGRLTVEFTGSADPDLVALGRDCVALDPTIRPTMAQALHRVHQVWKSCVSL